MPPKLDDFPVYERREDRADLHAYFQKQREELKDIVATAVATAVKAVAHEHGCPLPKEMRSYSPALYSILNDIGDGQIDRGIRTFRDHQATMLRIHQTWEEREENHKFISKLRRKANKIGSGVMFTSVSVIVAAFLVTGWQIVEWIVRIRGGNGG